MVWRFSPSIWKPTTLTTSIGKPEPGVLLEIARRLDVEPSRAALFEDALVGVEAGKRGGFGSVIGIDHGTMSSSKACERCT